jgi:hypothetical protein
LTYTIRDDDPLSAEALLRLRHELARDNWRVKVETATHLKSTERSLLLSGSLTAFLNGERVHEQSWEDEIPRDLV